jgi:hypothetical protein
MILLKKITKKSRDKNYRKKQKKKKKHRLKAAPLFLEEGQPPPLPR